MAGTNIDRPMWHRLFSTALGIIVTANVVIFLVVSGAFAFGRLNLAPWLGMLGPAEVWVHRPWGLLTYMFVQTDVLHLLFNMVWLWGFGTLMMRFDGQRALTRTYLAGGIGGALCFLIATGVSSGAGVSLLIGSSAAVMGVIAGASARQPRLKVGLVLFGSVELRVLGLIAIILLGVIPGTGSLPTLSAHLGGALAGWGYVTLAFRQSRPTAFGRKTTKRDQPLTNVRTHQRRGLNEEQQREMDLLLAKVKAVGYKNLSDEEKKRLFNISSYIK